MLWKAHVKNNMESVNNKKHEENNEVEHFYILLSEKETYKTLVCEI